MDIIVVLGWVGVFALAIGSLISIVSGGSLFVALFGVLLTSITVSSIIPINGKLRLILGTPRLELIQKLGVVAGAIGSWILAAVGGWEFVPAGMVLSVAAAWWPVMRVIEMRRARRNAMNANMIMSGEQGKQSFELPPQYTESAVVPVASTVTIVTEESVTQSPLKTPTCDKMQTPAHVPIFNV